MRMPTPDPAILARREAIIAALRRAVADPARVIDRPEAMTVYEADGLTAYRQMPLAVVLPDTTAEVAAVMRTCRAEGVKVVPRGAGTSLTGGALPVADGIVLGLARLNRVLDVDLANRCITVETGITNLAVSRRVEADGFFYAPDPSSQIACAIAGNIGMNSGGAHCLKYGVTANNVLGLAVVTLEGEVLTLGGKAPDAGGIDLMSLVIGSEGQLGVATEAILRLIPLPEGARPMLMGFGSAADAGACVAAIIGSGILPVALEYMDRPAIHACEAFAAAGYPLDVEALLIVEVEGAPEEIDALLERIATVARHHRPLVLRAAADAAAAAAIWKGRKSAFGAIGQISPDYLCMDGTIPTGRLPEVLERIGRMAAEAGLGVANIFHAGDGNLHPLILYDAQRPGEMARAEALGAAILRLCVEVGGCLTGEHGVGVEKRDLMPCQFSAAELDLQRRIKRLFDPDWQLNPGKVFPLESAA